MIHEHAVDTTVSYQTIENFGASDCWSIQRVGTWSDAGRERVADLLFSIDKGIGLSCWRFNVGGGINRTTIRDPWRTAETFEVSEGVYDWTRQAGERWFLRAAKARGVPQFLAFVNSPPGRMTRSGFTNSADDKTSSTNLKPDFEPQFATYLADVLEHFRNHPEPAERIPFRFISPINEPQNDWLGGNQEGCRYANADIKRVLKALHAELARRKLDVRIIAPESQHVADAYQPNANVSAKYAAAFGDYLDDFAADPELTAALEMTLAYHNYDSIAGDDLIRHHERLGQKLREHPGWKLWMSEICVMSPRRDLGIDAALAVAKMIHVDLTLSNASAWQWWLAMSPYDYKDGLLYTDWKEPGDPESIHVAKMLWALGHYSRFVRPGFRRIDLIGSDPTFKTLLGSAYLDPTSGDVVLVYVNLSDESQRVRWSMKIPPGVRAPGRFTPHVTSADADLTPTASVSALEVFDVPARSIVTLVSAGEH